MFTLNILMITYIRILFDNVNMLSMILICIFVLDYTHRDNHAPFLGKYFAIFLGDFSHQVVRFFSATFCVQPARGLGEDAESVEAQRHIDIYRHFMDGILLKTTLHSYEYSTS